MTTPTEPGPESYSELVEKLEGRVDRPRWEAVKVWLTGWLIHLTERRNPGEFDATVYDEPTPESKHSREAVPGGWQRVLLVLAAVLLLLIVMAHADPGQLWGVRIIPENYPT